MATLQGFQIVRIAFDDKQKSPHYLYMKRHTHQKKNDLTPTDRTIFLVNVPPYCTKRGLENMFASNGPIESVYVQDAPGPVVETDSEDISCLFQKEKFQFKVAYIVFKDTSSVNKVMNNDFTKTLYMSTKKRPIKTGIDKWCLQYKEQYPNPEKLLKKIDKFMGKYDLKEQEEKEELERLANEPDEEGWTLVSYGGKKPSAQPQERVTRKEKRKRQKKELLNFYTFQQRESKREHIATLRKKFEEDKKKVELMRAARKFKPF